MSVSEMIVSSVRRIREAKGISQRELAVSISVPRTYISKIENGRCLPTISSLERLAGALGVSPVALLTGDDAGGSSAAQDIVAAEKELLSDPFIVAIRPYILKMSKRHKSTFMLALEFTAKNNKRATRKKAA